ncbi:uncharacterized protein [Leptinotarsa decemlineata]|uniref:uncharacterized protein n=1 Tax=Leptinotarsa decemlineata TaxID=7539 RepID=UPI003D30A531
MNSGCAFCQCYKSIKKKKRSFKSGTDPLKNWEKWLRERKMIQDRLTKILKKPAGELLMNISEEIRRVREEKLVFAYSQITTHFDKQRGNPEFWHLPQGLKNNNCDGNRNPIYFSVKSKEDRNEIPSIEYVATPQFVFGEKSVLPRTRSLYDRWQKGSYRQRYLENMYSKLRFIEPHRPDQTNLIILGKRIPTEICSSPIETIPQCISRPKTDFKTKEISQISFKVYSIPALVFILNGTVLSNEHRLCNGSTKIRLIFNLDEIPQSPVVKILKFENKGLKTLRFYWNEFKKFRTFRDIVPNQKTASPFYFENTEILLVTGREFELPILFKPKTSGHFNESWEITTLPKIWDESHKVIVSLQGIVYEGNFQEDSENIRQMLDTNTRNTLIKEILNDALNNLKWEETSEVTYMFSEKELFECANLETHGAKKRTKYLYNKATVSKLKEFYALMKESTDDDEWNYSIDLIKSVTRKRDVLEYLKNLTDRCISAKNKLRQLNNPENYSSDNKMKAKSLGNGMEEEPLQYKPLGTNYKNLEILLSNLERPSMIDNKQRNKYVSVFFIFRRYISKMCTALEELDGISCKSAKTNYPCYDFEKVTEISELPERLIFERFDDVWIERTKRAPPEQKTDFAVTPKPKNLENIPPEDTELLYETYFNKTPKKGKNKIPADEKQKVKSKLKDQSSIRQNLTECSVKEGFDPFSNIDLFIAPKSEGSTTTLLEKTCVKKKGSVGKINDGSRYEKYLIVYTHLCEAVDAIVNTLETFRENDISSDMLGELIPQRQTIEKSAKPDEIDTIEINAERNSYFNSLVETHFNQNDAMHKYFVSGRTPAPLEELSLKHSPADPETIPYSFKSHESLVIKSVESLTSPKSIGIQTSLKNSGSECSAEKLNTFSAFDSEKISK